jgi:hypothetical protein
MSITSIDPGHIKASNNKCLVSRLPTPLSRRLEDHQLAGAEQLTSRVSMSRLIAFFTRTM